MKSGALLPSNWPRVIMTSYNRPKFDRQMMVIFLTHSDQLEATTCTMIVCTSVIKRSKHILFSDMYRS